MKNRYPATQVFISILFPIIIIAFFSGSSSYKATNNLKTYPKYEEPDFEIPRIRIRLSPKPLNVGNIKNPILDLTGIWKFHPSPQPEFVKQTKPGKAWKNIHVPGEWSMQGYSVDKNTAAGYWNIFNLPDDWKGRRIKLRCDSIYSECVIYINGKESGSHLGGLTPFELDISDHVKTGKNTIAIAVKSYSLADTLGSINQYAAHDIGGILRKLYLIALPEINLANFHAETKFDSNYSDATLKAIVEIANEGGIPSSGIEILFSLRTYPQSVIILEKTFKVSSILSGQSQQLDFEFPVSAPKKWDPEHPNLYVLHCTLKANEQKQTASRRFGFRQVEVFGNSVFVNGKKIILRGVNRHEAHPIRGRSLRPEDWRQDAELFREANCNYIRTSHYPPAEEFIAACDELGLFVEEEAPLCWIGHNANQTWQSQDPQNNKYFAYIQQCILEMIQRDRSHPSVIIWSLANESVWGPNWHWANKNTARADPSRPRTFHDQSWGEYNNKGSTEMPIANFHYSGPDGPGRVLDNTRPQLFGEYCHLNSYNRYELVTDPSVRDGWGRGLHRMWERIWNSKPMLGGAIWSGIDDTFFMPDNTTVGYGSWGPIDGWRRKKPEWWHMKKVYSPIRVNLESLQQTEKDLKIQVENRQNFSNLNELNIVWSAGERKGTTTADIDPHSTGWLQIPLNVDTEKIYLHFHSPRGFLVDTYFISLKKTTIAAEPKIIVKQKTPQLSFTEKKIIIEGEDFLYEINKVTGRITKGVYQGKTIFFLGPDLMVLPLNNEGGTQMTGENQTFAPYTHTCSNWEAKSCEIEESDKFIKIRVKGQYQEAEGEYILLIENDGSINIDYCFESLQEVNPRQIGMVFSLPQEFNTLSWQRLGYWSVYPDDHIGRNQGTAEAFPNSHLVGPAGPTNQPSWDWAQDCLETGSNDFRSTKENIFWAELMTGNGYGLRVESNGTQHVRSWVADDSIKMLVADHNTPGAEGFFRRHASSEDHPLKPGDQIKGTIRLRMKTSGEIKVNRNKE